MTPRLQFAVEAAYEAGRSTLGLFGTRHSVEIKADDSPVTEADKLAERLLRSRIAAAFPGDGIVGEEEGSTGSMDRRWVLDPIDGTKSFICGVPLFATLLAFEEGGERRLGVAYFPALDLMVHAEIGGGAFANGRPIAVSAETDLSQSAICTGSWTTFDDQGRLEGMLKISRAARSSRTWGDAYGHCLVAMGRAEAMIDPRVAPWDLAAVQVIVEEAGGAFTDFKGGRNPQIEAISSNGLLHTHILEAF